MNLEFYDVFSIFTAGLALGLIGAHYLNKYDRAMEYERGKLDAVWAIQCEVMRIDLARRLEPSRDQATGGQASDSKPV